MFSVLRLESSLPLLSDLYCTANHARSCSVRRNFPLFGKHRNASALSRVRNSLSLSGNIALCRAVTGKHPALPCSSLIAATYLCTRAESPGFPPNTLADHCPTHPSSYSRVRSFDASAHTADCPILIGQPQSPLPLVTHPGTCTIVRPSPVKHLCTKKSTTSSGAASNSERLRLLAKVLDRRNAANATISLSLLFSCALPSTILKSCSLLV